MTERQLSKAVVELAERLGWRVFTISNTKAAALRSHTGVGFPDLFMVRKGKAIAAELKVKGRKPTKAQLTWMVDLGEAGIEPYVWREEHWTNRTVEKVLRRVEEWQRGEEVLR